MNDTAGDLRPEEQERLIRLASNADNVPGFLLASRVRVLTPQLTDTERRALWEQLVVATRTGRDRYARRTARIMTRKAP